VKTAPLVFLRTPVGRELRWASLILALLFSASAIAQYLFIQWRIGRTAELEFDTWAAELKQEINYRTEWNMKKFHQADWRAPGCYIFTTNGLILDIEGFVPGLVGQVVPPEVLNYGTPSTITSEIGETWRVLAKKVTGGMVILADSQNGGTPELDALLLQSANQFGSSLEEAAKVRPRDINQNIDFAVLDASGNLKFAIGGVPVKTTPPSVPGPSGSQSKLLTSGKSYVVASYPIVDASGTSVGTVAIPREDTLERQTLHTSVWFNIGLAMLSWLTVGSLTASYFARQDKARRAHRLTLDEALGQDESDTLEFKSSVRWDYDQKRVNKDLEGVIVKEVAAFLNSLGGLLVIGVDNDKRVVGLQPDYDSSSKIKNRDGLERHLQQLISTMAGVDRFQLNIRIEFYEKKGVDVCMVRVKPASQPVILKDQNAPLLYVRAGGATKTLNVEEALRYVHEHWGA
jgi:hypothetical protein